MEINNTHHIDNIAFTETNYREEDATSRFDSEIEDIISRTPPAFVRWGTFYFFLFLIAIGFICWLIRYPKMVSTTATLNSVNPPRQVIAKIDGKLKKINVSEDTTVRSGEILGYMESIANPAAVLKIDSQIDSMNKLISKQRTDELKKYYPDNISNLQFVKELGELQADYQTFMQSFTAFKNFLSTGFYIRKKKMLATDLKNYKKQHSILNTQKELLEQDLQLSMESFKANESLAKEKVISNLDYRNEKSKLIAKQLTLPQINSAIVLNESQQNQKKEEIAELENQITVQKSSFVQALQTMKSNVDAWELKYLLRAPVSGKVTFVGFFEENQEVKLGQPLFYVEPDNTEYFAEMLIPQYNFGNVKKGQQVLLKFQAYPFEQYGAVAGKIESINPMPTDSGYLSKVMLPKGLTTNYNRELKFQNGLIAQADIITEKRRLLESLLYDLKRLLKL